MNSKTALIAGATGLIGSQLLPLLLASDRYSKVIVIGRRNVSLTHPRLSSHIVDFDNLRARLKQNSVTEKLTNLWLTRLLAKESAAI